MSVLDQRVGVLGVSETDHTCKSQIIQLGFLLLYVKYGCACMCITGGNQLPDPGLCFEEFCHQQTAGG